MLNRFANILIVSILLCLSVWLFAFENNTYGAQNTTEQVLVKNGAGPGRDIYVPKNPQRVVILTPSSFDMWLNLGGRDYLVGVPKFRDTDKALYQRINEQTTILGTYAYRSPEMVLKLRPDLVIMNGYDAAQDFMGEFLRRKNIPLMTLPGRSVQDTYKELELFGILLDSTDTAHREVGRIKTNIEENYSKYAFRTKKKSLLIFGTPASFSMFTPDTRQGNMLELAGGENVIKRTAQFLGAKYIPLSLEYAALINPDYVFFINHGNPAVMERKTKEALADSSAWNTIKAVKEGRVYVLPPEYFITNPGLKTDYAINSLSKILYAGED